ncbi:hypothetical protein LCGC14_1911170 [marine sediment metagenome]|uniref:Homeodomain phBC6A51-type domain-containing protein n=1 Tax=marine sediment metagenome TaxID=412755 RepID=A0A0F9FTN3_9ZZZZ
MYPPKEKAAKLLAVGESMKDVAKAVKKDEQTVKLWLLEEDFCQLLRENVQGAALRIIIGYLVDEHADKDKAMVALALLRMNKPSPPRNGPRKPVEDETDIDGFSEDQLKRLEGDD